MSEAQPSISCIGVYRVPFDEQNLRDQWRHYYFSGNVQRDIPIAVTEFLDRCIPLTLFEIELNSLDDRFSGQTSPKKCPRLRENTGRRLTMKRFFHLTGHRSSHKSLFVLKGFDVVPWPSISTSMTPKPMQWTYGLVRACPVEMIPKRLWALLPYVPVD